MNRQIADCVAACLNMKTHFSQWYMILLVSYQMKRFSAVSVQEQPRSAFIQFALKVPLFTAWPFCR